MFVQIVGDHRAVALLQCLEATVDGFAGKPETANLAFGLERGEGVVDFAVIEDRQVVTIGVHQHQVDEVGFQALQAAFHRHSSVCGAEIVTGLAVGKLLADLADNHPILTLTAQQRAEAFFAATIGRGGVDQVDAQVAGEFEQPACFIVIGNLKAVGVLHPLVAAQFHGAQAQG
ncbi:hypothetical protein D3C78_1122710 [compost metagenome]